MVPVKKPDNQVKSTKLYLMLLETFQLLSGSYSETIGNFQISSSYSFPNIFFLWSFPLFYFYLLSTILLFPMKSDRHQTQNRAPISALLQASTKGMKRAAQALCPFLCPVGMQIILGFWVHGIGWLKQWLPWAWNVIPAQRKHRNSSQTTVPCSNEMHWKEVPADTKLSNPLPPFPCLPMFLKNISIGNKTVLSLFWETIFWNISSSRTCRTLSIQFHWQGEKHLLFPDLLSSHWIPAPRDPCSCWLREESPDNQ